MASTFALPQRAPSRLYGLCSLALGLGLSAVSGCGGVESGDEEPEGTSADGVVAPTRFTSLSRCWLDPNCRRVMVISHGGDWDGSNPYLSRAAFDRAVTCGAEAIEAPVRLTADHVPVLAHSSPIEWWESLNCMGDRIEQMTAAQVTRCRLFPSGQRFQRLDDALTWANGKVIFELDPKVSAEVPEIVNYVLARGAADRAFFMVTPAELPTLPAGASYMLRVRDPAQLPLRAPGLFMMQLDRSYPGVNQAAVRNLINTQVHPNGLKALTESVDNAVGATVANQVAIANQGFDVILSYNCANGVSAARQVNAARGL